MLFVIDAQDNVATALEEIPLGTVAPLLGAATGILTVAESIPRGHKISLTAIKEGDAIVKHGYPVAIASRDILPGVWVHSHNAVSPRDHTREAEHL